MYAILATVMFVMTLFCFGVGSPTGEVLHRAMPNMLDMAQGGVSRYLGPWLWDGLVARVLAQPAWTLPAGLTVIFVVIAVLPELIGVWRPRPFADALERPDAARNGTSPGAPRV